MSTYIPITEYFHIKMYKYIKLGVGTYMEMKNPKTADKNGFTFHKNVNK